MFTVLGPEVHDLVFQVELPKPAATSLRRAKKIPPAKFSRTGDMNRLATLQSAILAGDVDKQREIGHRIGQIMIEVGFTNYTVYAPISATIRHAACVAGRRGATDVGACLQAHLWTPEDDELASRFNNVGDENRSRTFTELFRRFDRWARRRTSTHGKRGYPVAWQFKLEAAADFGLRGGNDDWPVDLVDYA